MKNILFVLHNDFNKGSKKYIGGTQFHVKDLVYGLKDKYNIYVISKNGKRLKFSFYHYNIKKSINFDLKRYVFDNLYKIILIKCNIDIVHVHHIEGLSTNIFSLAKDFKIPVIATLHDYYYICPNVKLYNHKNEYCRTKLTKSCSRCMLTRSHILMGEDQLIKWRQDNLELLTNCNLLIAPSYADKRIYTTVFPSLLNKIIVIQHGVEIPHPKRIQRTMLSKKSHINVAFLGGQSPAKGSKFVYDVIKQPSELINWFIIGGIQDIKLRLFQKPNLTKIGWYDREKVPDILAKLHIDLVCIFSMWPETYCYTLSEAITNYIPVIAIDIGAVGERMRQLDSGWLFPVQVKVQEIISLIKEIQQNPSDYLAKVNNLRNSSFFSTEQMLQRYKQIYDSICEQ